MADFKGQKNRIKMFISHIETNVSQFEKSLGLSNGYINSMKIGIGYDKLEQISNMYPDLNMAWLLTGDGPMLNSEKIVDQTPVASPTDNPEEGIPLIPVSAMAGALSGEQTVLEYECERYVVPVFKGADFLIPVKGSSMYPKYSSGDIVACKRVNMSGLFFQWGKVYVIDTDQGGLIKRIKRGSDPDHILIVSDNESYEPFELPLSGVHSVAIVLGVIRLE